MKLSADQFKMLSDGLLDRYPTYIDLAIMVRIKLHPRTLEAIVAESGTKKAIYYLIGSANSEGWVADLIKAVCEDSPGHPILEQLYDEYFNRPSIAAAPGTANHYAACLLWEEYPLLGRGTMREIIEELLDKPDRGKRIYVVKDKETDKKTGKTYTSQFIKYLRDVQNRNIEVAWVLLEEWYEKSKNNDGNLSVEAIGRDIAARLSLDTSTLKQQGTEKDERWVSDYVNWLQLEIKKAPEDHWIVFDDCRDYMLKVKPLIEGLARIADESLDNLRLILLNCDKEALPPSVSSRVRDEEIDEIWEEEVIAFFEKIHLFAQSQHPAADVQEVSEDVLAERVATSTAKVLREVDPDDLQRLKYLQIEAQREAQAILTSRT